MQNVSFILFSGWIFSGLVHFKLIVLPSILNKFKRQTHVQVASNQYLIEMSRAGFHYVLCSLFFFFFVAAANVKANPRQNLPLNERFMIQRCVLMPELQSVMKR